MPKLRDVLEELTRSKPLPNCCHECDKKFDTAILALQSLIMGAVGEFHGLLPTTNRKDKFYCISCSYELKNDEDNCPHNKILSNLTKLFEKEE